MARLIRPELWTRERLLGLGRQELLQLRDNAARLSEPQLTALCDELLENQPARGRASSGAVARSKMRMGLIPRAKAFRARGVWLQDARLSWSGLRKSDGAVVFAIWAGAIESRRGECRCILWAPNLKGNRPWSDSPAGRERREHCELALKNEVAEGLLVHGEAMAARLPEDRAHSVQGIDPEKSIRFRVVRRGAEYWAVWGKSTLEEK